jgi:hypothetical protein
LVTDRFQVEGFVWPAQISRLAEFRSRFGAKDFPVEFTTGKSCNILKSESFLDRETSFGAWIDEFPVIFLVHGNFEGWMMLGCGCVTIHATIAEHRGGSP